jgi:serine/threonine-protein kinase ULK4
VRIRLCSVIGLLIRHSTVIENEVADSDVCTQLIEALKDKNEKVRRKAIAALGEYMFYAATQLDDDQADPCWEIKDDAILAIIRSLKENEDETVRFYASKTLENITA